MKLFRHKDVQSDSFVNVMESYETINKQQYEAMTEALKRVQLSIQEYNKTMVKLAKALEQNSAELKRSRTSRKP